MEKEVTDKLELLIKEQEERIPQLKKNDSYFIIYHYEDEDSYINWVEEVKRFLEVYFPKDKHIADFEKFADKERISGLSPQGQKRLLAILKAFREHPVVVEKTNHDKSTSGININTNISNTNTQSQQQSQQQSIEILIKALEDQLSVSQLKEIKQVVEEAKGDLEKAKPKLIDKIKSFGENVTSNILANIITNPAIWALLG